jgi:hypothetical protein
LFWKCRTARRNAPQRARTRGNAAKTARLSTARIKFASANLKHRIEIALLKIFAKHGKNFSAKVAGALPKRDFANKDSHGRRFQRYLSVLAESVSQRKRLRDIAA